ncbi:MAG: PAS domain S-box protein [Alphaproteobacteria bacterium]|nr:PAS domain S-box protein [Alphaproteobacteria bacterium]
MIDRRGEIVMVNTQAERVFGYSRAELLGRPVEVLVPERFRQHHPGLRGAFFTDLRARPMGAGRDLYGRRKDGSEFPVEIGLNPIETDEGTMVLSAVVDITRRRRLEERFRLVVEAAPNAMVMINQAGEIVMVNAQTEQVFGYSRAELLGRPVEMLVPERFRQHHPGLREAFFTDLRARPMGAGRDLYGRRKDGSEFPVEIGLNPIETDEGTMVLSAIIDISERKASEAALRRSQIRLQELQSELLHVSRLTAMGQVTAMVAHELNQPLTAISNYMEAIAHFLGRGGDLPLGTLSDAVERAGGQALRAGQIIRRLGEFVSRGESKKQIETLSLLVKESTELVLPGTRHQGISIRVHDLAESAVVVDKIQIQQVLLNLLRNAVEAVADQELRVITLLTEQQQDMVQISVVDNGPGLADEVKSRLFEPFVSTKKTGMGIGLSICQTIVAAHNGRLWSEDNPEGGTIFRFTLPKAPADAQADV